MQYLEHIYTKEDFFKRTISWGLCAPRFYLAKVSLVPLTVPKPISPL